MAQPDTPVTPTTSVRRLCSEIQLFDLCDRERCGHRDGRYCTDPALLARFERVVAEEDDGPDRLVYVDDDEGEGEGETEFAGGEFGDDGGDDDDWDE